jgi:hypothetical protein
MRDTIDMAREAGKNISPDHGLGHFLKRFEALVRADTLANIDPSKFMSYQEAYEVGQVAEREACAKVCDDAFSSSHAGRVVCENLAYAIRARGNT